MPIMLKMYAALGMLWSLVIIGLTIAYWRDDALILVLLSIAFHLTLFFVCWRSYCLRRIPTLVVCTYCVSIAVQEYQYGSLNATWFWGVTALIVIGLTCVTWPQLKDGL